MTGKIVKGIAGFYYVHVRKKGIYECKAKGIFRKDGIKPLVGDNVEITILDEEQKLGNIDTILPRKNALIRPAVANVDQALVIFAAAKPEPNLNLLDRFLLSMEKQNVPCLICFNKLDMIDDAKMKHLQAVYEDSGYEVLFTSSLDGQGMEELLSHLEGKTTTVAGPSGVGKSSIVNILAPDAEMETGSISQKIERGKHTTRHSEILALPNDAFILDTPGFSSLEIMGIESNELELYYPEFEPYLNTCRFTGCAHIHEPDCGIKDAVEEGRIHKERYDNYCSFYEELKDKEKRRY